MRAKTWQAGSIITANNIKVCVAGSGKKLRGMRFGPYRPDLVVLDDIENDRAGAKPCPAGEIAKLAGEDHRAFGRRGAQDGHYLHRHGAALRQRAGTHPENRFWRGKLFKAVVRYPDNMDLWEEWETLWRNEGEEVAMAFYHARRADMERGAKTSWAARGILALMKSAPKSAATRLPANTKTTLRAATMRPLRI